MDCFKKPEDIRKIYGFTKEEADILIPYIKIKSEKFTTKGNIKKMKAAVDKPQAQTQIIKKIDINSATAEDWKTLPGIGDVLSNRIVKFRNSIHGFKSVEDVKKLMAYLIQLIISFYPYLTINDSLNTKNIENTFYFSNL